jgi:hypothetical protein
VRQNLLSICECFVLEHHTRGAAHSGNEGESRDGSSSARRAARAATAAGRRGLAAPRVKWSGEALGPAAWGKQGDEGCSGHGQGA